ncbi:hypothetical protein FACS1894187_01400 [Synergistales bacterium]|nr:hypothetical protein FACS1894187_01400 [Synergistales bacterium]
MTMTQKEITYDEAYAFIYITAVHEAGHAVMNFLWRSTVDSITIIPDEDRGRGGCCRLKKTKKLERVCKALFYGEKPTLRDMEYYFQSSMAGEIAEHLVFGKDPTAVLNGKYVSSDTDKAFEAVRALDLPDEWAYSLYVDALFKLEPHVTAIKKIADELMVLEKMSGALARKIFVKERSGG